jgi:hypothetical protein
MATLALVYGYDASGQYGLWVPDRVARGELRPLRDPNQPADEE